MESQTIFFTNSPYTTSPIPSFYTSYHTPPYTFNCSAWPEAAYQPFSMNEDVLQMQQQLRFPTPPITPPRSYNNTTADFVYVQPLQESAENQNKTQQQQRTQSVIMKIGHDQNPQYVPADLPYEKFPGDAHNIQPELHEQDHHHHNHHYDQQQLQSHNDSPSSGNSSPTSQNEFICDWKDCGRYFESLELLAHHVTLIHAVSSLTDGLYYCRWTGCQRTERGFNARYKMLVHVRTHTKEKPHQCHLCDKRFSRAENLKIHIRSHSGEKPYICTFVGCNKAYSNSSDRFKHTRTHSMEKPYMCKVPGCQKRYTDPSSLRKHVKTFKHSVQILDFKTTANVQQPKTFNNAEGESPVPSIEPIGENRLYLMLPNESSAAATQDSFCMAMEDMCHIKASFNCYPEVALTPVEKATSYWSQEAETKSALHHLHPSQYNAMQLDISADMPLDLRVKRS